MGLPVLGDAMIDVRKEIVNATGETDEKVEGWILVFDSERISGRKIRSEAEQGGKRVGSYGVVKKRDERRGSE